MSGRWNDPNGWSPSLVPDNDKTDSFAVHIDGADSGVSIALESERTVNTADCRGAVNLRGDDRRPILRFAGSAGLANHGDLSLEQLAIIGQISNTSNATLTLATRGLDITGGLSNAADGVIRAVGVVDFHGGTIMNNGEIVFGDLSRVDAVPGGGVTGVTNNGILRLRGGSCVRFDRIYSEKGAIIVGTGFVQAQLSVENAGIIYAYLGNLLIDSYGSITNRGTLLNLPGSTLNLYTEDQDCVNTGTIIAKLNGGVTFIDRSAQHALINKDGGKIRLNGGTLSAPRLVQAASATFSGFGAIDAKLVIEANASVTLTGPTNIVGSVEIQAGATLAITAGDILITGAVEGDGTIRLTGGELILQGGISGNCQIIEAGGVYVQGLGAEQTP
ncbi:MAG: hypothetical protein KBE65_23645 [Phycisphaerae bacterium]|nr:hypothetical protein [Phycisphaerae bacterium]